MIGSPAALIGYPPALSGRVSVPAPLEANESSYGAAGEGFPPARLAEPCHAW